MPFKWVEQTAVFVLVSFLFCGTGLESVYFAIQNRTDGSLLPADGGFFFDFCRGNTPRVARASSLYSCHAGSQTEVSCRLHLLGYGEFRDDAGLDLDAFCERCQRDAFILAVHALQVVLGQREWPQAVGLHVVQA